MEPVYRSIEIAAAAAARMLGTRITYEGLENIPERGGAVIVMNHISYIDYLPTLCRLVRSAQRVVNDL